MRLTGAKKAHHYNMAGLYSDLIFGCMQKNYVIFKDTSGKERTRTSGSDVNLVQRVNSRET